MKKKGWEAGHGSRGVCLRVAWRVPAVQCSAVQCICVASSAAVALPRVPLCSAASSAPPPPPPPRPRAPLAVCAAHVYGALVRGSHGAAPARPATALTSFCACAISCRQCWRCRCVLVALRAPFAFAILFDFFQLHPSPPVCLAAMDEYMREMVDLKTLVTKTLEKKGVLARIRAELRANVFQAMEEQDHEAESNGSTTFSLLGTCNERAKKLHASSSGKLLMALVCEYMEWCELEHTLKVYMPELNQPRIYSRTDLEDILGLVGEPKADSPESQPLLLSIVESFLNEKKDTSFTGPAAQVKQSRHGPAGGPRQFSGNPSSVLDPSEALEARVSMSNKKLSEKSMGGMHAQSRSEAESLGSANDGTISPRLSDDSQKNYERSSSRAQALLADLPQHRRSSGLPAFSGVSRPGPNARGSNSLANDQQAVVGGVDGGGTYARGSRDRDNDGKRREYSWSEEDEAQGGSSGNKKKEGGWRDQDYDNLYMNPPPRSEKGDGKGQVGEDSTSGVRRTASVENASKALGNLHLDDDSGSEFGGRQSSGSRGTPTGQRWQVVPRDNSLQAASAGSKKQASAYFYSDSEEENAPE